MSAEDWRALHRRNPTSLRAKRQIILAVDEYACSKHTMLSVRRQHRRAVRRTESRSPSRVGSAAAAAAARPGGGALGGQGAGVAVRLLDPAPEVVITIDAGAADEEHAGHRAAREVHGTGAGLEQRLLECFLAGAHHQLGADDAAEHVAAAHESEAAEHLSLRQVRPLAQEAADAAGQRLVVSHAVLPGSYNRSASSEALPGSVTVAQEPLELRVQVRILARQPCLCVD